eukprot:SAG22_NODE_2675_length_2316_cov_2.573297_1_plen_397_part_00
MIRSIAAALRPCAPRAAAAPGHCLDRVLPEGSYAGVSALRTHSQCVDAGHAWCPLRNDTAVDQRGGEDYYRYSACCLGRQGRGLLVSSAGRPTCEAGTDPANCTRLQWQSKLLRGLLRADNGDRYNRLVAPVTNRLAPPVESTCSCAANASSCLSASGEACLLCRTDARCTAELVVEVSLGVFKLAEVELQRSGLSVSARWHDPRLEYHALCFGGLGQAEVLAAATAGGGGGESDETGVIWTPDIELYNQHQQLAGQQIWGSPLGHRSAVISACAEGPAGCSQNILFSRCGKDTALRWCSIVWLCPFRLCCLLSSVLKPGPFLHTGPACYRRSAHSRALHGSRLVRSAASSNWLAGPSTAATRTSSHVHWTVVSAGPTSRWRDCRRVTASGRWLRG